MAHKSFIQKILVDTAARVKAKVVVIHAGTVDFEDNRAPRLFELYNDGQKDSKEFELERERILIMREEKREPYLQALRKSLSDVTSHAQEKDIQIGLETRYYPLEIPNFDEIGYFLNIFKSNGMGYWHDVGHAQVNSLLGITPHLDFLKTYKKQLIGVHLHDTKGTKDHHAPFEGEMDLNSYLSYFGKDVLRVIESKPYASVEAMKKAVAL